MTVGIVSRTSLSLSTSGSTAVASLFAPSAVPSKASSALSISALSGTMMAHHATRPPLTTQRSSCALSLSSRIPSAVLTISSSCATLTDGLTLPARSLSLPTPTSVFMPRKFSMPLMKNPGSVSSRNTLLLVLRPSSPPGLSAGPTMATLALRVLTTALPVPAIASGVLSLMPTTGPASTLVSRSQARTPRSCLVNGSTKSDPSRVSLLVTTSGCHAISSSALLRTSMSTSRSPLSSSRTGMALAATLTSPLRPCVLALVAWSTSTT